MEVKKTFVQGKMSKDVDERLLPDGQFPHAENIRVVTTDGSNLGAVQNIEGNTQMTNYNLTNAQTIGAFADGARYKLYWFVTSDEKDMILEFDTQTGVPTVVLESSKPDSVLNFNPNYLITGVAKVKNDVYNKDLLAWTDDYNNPRCVNIERAKTYNPDGFEEEDICLIKQPPRYALQTQLTFTTSTLENNMEDKFISFAYRYKYLDGEYSALSTFTNYQFAPKQFSMDYQTMENDGMINAFNAVKLIFNTGSKRVTDIELVYKESNSNVLYRIESFSKSQERWADDSEEEFLFSNNKKYKALPSDELFRAYDNVPRVAKALDLVGNRLLYGDYVEGYDLVNVYGEEVKMDYELEVNSLELGGQIVPVTFGLGDTLLGLDLTGINLRVGTRLDFSLGLNQTSSVGNFDGNATFILNNTFASPTELAADPDFVFFVETILTDLFTNGYTATPPANSGVPEIDSFIIVASSPTNVVIKAPTLIYTVDDTPLNPDDDVTHEEVRTWKFKVSTSVYFRKQETNSSLKTNRSYEVGFIYMDKEARATPVQTTPNNTVYIPQEFSVSQNKLQVTVNHLPPVYADRYKLVVKQNKAEYQTIYTNVFYQDGIYRWVLVEGANKDKVHEGDTLIVKSDLSGPLSDIIKVRVLEVSSKPKDFIPDNKGADGNNIIEEAGLYMKIKPVNFNMNFDASTNRAFAGFRGDLHPKRVYTTPVFGEYVGGAFVPYKLKAGSRVGISIRFTNKLNAYDQSYEKMYRVQAAYPSIKAWFEAEVQNLGQFGIEHTWNGLSNIGPTTTSEAGYGQADAFNKNSGWGFTPNGEQFWVRSEKDGTFTVTYSILVFTVFFSEGDVIFETEAEDNNSDIYYETEQTFDIVDGRHTGNVSDQTLNDPAVVEMDFFNCFAQGNGAESYRYKDTFNGKYLNIDLRPSTTTLEKYREIRRFADMTYSEPYSGNINVNGLNEFNLSKANYKDDLEKRYGSIQKLFARESNVLVMQEDKIGQVFYGKDLLYNADGSTNLASIDQVLGQWQPYTGEYGISRNPESFVFDGFNIYFTDVKRGAVMRLAGDGLNEIPFGMKQFFKRQFSNNDDTTKKGGFDANFDEYYLHDSEQELVRPKRLDCGQSVDKTGFTGSWEAIVDYTSVEGSAGFAFTTNGKPVRFKIEFSNFVLETGFYGNASYNAELINMGYSAVIGSSSSAVMFDKTRDLPTTINSNTIPLNIGKITVFSPFEDVDINITTLCPV